MPKFEGYQTFRREIEHDVSSQYIREETMKKGSSRTLRISFLPKNYNSKDGTREIVREELKYLTAKAKEKSRKKFRQQQLISFLVNSRVIVMHP